MKPKACGKCGTEFERKHIAEKYCSDTCRMKVIREKAALVNATPERKEAIKENLRRWRKRLQETPEGRAKLASYRKPRPDREPRAKTCRICKNEFLADSPYLQICSDACRKLARKVHWKKLATKRLNDPEARQKHREHTKLYMRERAKRLREQKANSVLVLTAEIKLSKDARTTT